jgi:lysylphosphatidylglycerol synthetase-like protein (DUF2156 family)
VRAREGGRDHNGVRQYLDRCGQGGDLYRSHASGPGCKPPEQGYRRFNLGMAPLAGLEDRSLAPLWTRLGAQIFRYGEHFYNFQGLRQFKEHFDPEWEPKYLVAPRGFLLPRVLANLASLISGGIMGAIKK